MRLTTIDSLAHFGLNVKQYQTEFQREVAIAVFSYRLCSGDLIQDKASFYAQVEEWTEVLRLVPASAIHGLYLRVVRARTHTEPLEPSELLHAWATRKSKYKVN